MPEVHGQNESLIWIVSEGRWREGWPRRESPHSSSAGAPEGCVIGGSLLRWAGSCQGSGQQPSKPQTTHRFRESVALRTTSSIHFELKTVKMTVGSDEQTSCHRRLWRNMGQLARRWRGLEPTYCSGSTHHFRKFFLSASSSVSHASGMMVTTASQASWESKSIKDFKWYICDCNSVHAHVRIWWVQKSSRSTAALICPVYIVMWDRLRSKTELRLATLLHTLMPTGSEAMVLFGLTEFELHDQQRLWPFWYGYIFLCGHFHRWFS